MKKFAVYFRGIEFFGVLAGTQEEARKKAISDLISYLENEMCVVEMKARTERCDNCDYTYLPKDIVPGDGEQLCVSCYAEKYEPEEPDLSDIDIPF